jgi:hypothetical protein
MAEIPTPQAPADARQVMRALNADGSVAFGQVQFNELDFGAVFGGKTTSSTQNTIGLGRKTFTLDNDDGRMQLGHTVQITSLDNPRECFMYGVVIRKDTTTSPAEIEVAVQTVSELIAISTNWEIQIVEVSRDITLQVGDADVVLDDHHRIVFYTVPLTAPRSLTTSPGTTLIPGTRLLIVDGIVDGGAFGVTNHLTIDGSHQLVSAGDFCELVWNGAAWVTYNQNGYYFAIEAGSRPVVVEEFDNSANEGPYISAIKNSASPAANDFIGVYVFGGYDLAGAFQHYAQLGGQILDPTAGSQDGAVHLKTMQGGVLTLSASFAQGIYLPGAAGGDKGPGTLNAVGLYVGGVAVGAGSPTTTRGDIIARGAAADQRVALGASGTIVSSDGVDTKFQTPLTLGLAVLLASGTVAAAATLDLVLTAYTGYSKLVFELINFIPATDNVQLLTRLSTNGGVSYDATANNYFYGTADGSSDGGGLVSHGNKTATSIPAGEGTVTANGIGNGAAEGISMTLELPGQTSTVVKPKVTLRYTYYSANDNCVSGDGGGLRNAAQDTDAIRFLFSAGNIASGTYRVWGYK